MATKYVHVLSGSARFTFGFLLSRTVCLTYLRKTKLCVQSQGNTPVTEKYLGFGKEDVELVIESAIGPSVARGRGSAGPTEESVCTDWQSYLERRLALDFLLTCAGSAVELNGRSDSFESITWLDLRMVTAVATVSGFYHIQKAQANSNEWG